MSRHPNVIFTNKDGKRWAEIRAGFIYIAVGYAWNGSSPKHYIGFPPIGTWIGTPDFYGTRKASLVHDVLYQFAEVGEYSFEDANYQFLKLMEDAQFPLAQQYYEAVEIFGGKFWGKDKSGVKAIYNIHHENI